MIRPDGLKLPAMIIFQEKNGIIPGCAREKLKIPDNIIVKATKTGYINANLLKDYFSLIR